jgi:hypothetical protein
VRRWQFQRTPSMSQPSAPQALPDANAESRVPTARSSSADRSPGLSAPPRQWTAQVSVQATGNPQVLSSSNWIPSSEAGRGRRRPPAPHTC